MSSSCWAPGSGQAWEGCLGRAWPRRQVAGVSMEPDRSEKSGWHPGVVGRHPARPARPYPSQEPLLASCLRFGVPVVGWWCQRSADQSEVGLSIPRPSSPFRTHMARFKQARGWLGAVYFRLTAQHSGYIYLAKLLAI